MKAETKEKLKAALSLFLSISYSLSNTALYMNSIILFLENTEWDKNTEDALMYLTYGCAPFLTYSNTKAYFDVIQELQKKFTELQCSKMHCDKKTAFNTANTFSASIGSLLKTIASFISLYDFSKRHIGGAAAVGVGLVFLPGNLISQFSFLGQKLVKKPDVVAQIEEARTERGDELLTPTMPKTNYQSLS